MKTKHLLILLGIFISACQSPQQLYKKGADEAAYSKLLNKKASKFSEKNSALLVRLHTEQLDKEIELINDWSRDATPEVWPRIKGRLDRIAIQQEAFLKICQEQNLAVSEFKTFPNLTAKIEEATTNSAAYYYDRQQEEYLLAKAGNKEAARRGYALGEKVMSYLPNYKSVVTSNKALKEIGMDYVLVYIEEYKAHVPTEFCLDYFKEQWAAPEIQEWSTVSFEEEHMPRVDYWLRLSPEEARLGPPQWSSASCVNSKEVEVGTQIIEEWSEKDSAYVEKEIPIIEEAFVEVTNIEQFRIGDFQISASLFLNGKKEALNEEAIDVVYRWANRFGEISGDDRAVDISCCPVAGFESSFPSEDAMLRSLGAQTKFRVQNFLDASLESYDRVVVERKNLFSLFR